MKVLSPRVIATARSGIYQYAIIESVAGKRATVKLGAKGKGARLTNLAIAGRANVGDLVIVDYSVATPYVRSVQYIEPEKEKLKVARRPLES